MTQRADNPDWCSIAMFLIGVFGGFFFGTMEGIAIMQEHPDWVAQLLH